MSERSRRALLAAVRAASAAAGAPGAFGAGSGVPLLPELPAEEPGAGDAGGGPARRARFGAALEAAGGRCLTAPDVAAIDAVLAGHPPFAAAGRRVSLVAGAGRPNVHAAPELTPRALASVDFALVPAELGVAENGAVWVREPAAVSRAVFLLPEHLGVVLRADTLVEDLHAAYERLAPGLARGRFGAFLCGPSKTADIEQALVVGAHGPRSLVVVLREG